MSPTDRRRFLQIVAVLSSTGFFCGSSLAKPGGHSCSLSAAQAKKIASLAHGIGVVGEQLSFSTGDSIKDRDLGRALVRVSQLFGERPGFGFIDDSHAPNAYATDEHRVTGTWGTVLFGKTLFEDLLQRFDDGGIAILAVIAHEFGHIAQYHRKVYDTLIGGQSTKKRAELHADLLAGYFLGSRQQQSPWIKLRTAGIALYQIGDYAFNEEDHHGTPKERVAAAEYGYKLAIDKKKFSEAFDGGMNWIMARYSK